MSDSIIAKYKMFSFYILQGLANHLAVSQRYACRDFAVFNFMSTATTKFSSTSIIQYYPIEDR